MAQFDKSKPAGNQKIRLGDDDIRSNNDALEDAIGRDHKFPTGYGTDAGEHTKISFNAPTTTPAAVANKGFLYTKDASAKAELHFEDEDGNEVQFTSAGLLLLISNYLKLNASIATPATEAGKGFVYLKSSEFYLKDPSGNEIQLTSGGALNVPAAAAASVPSGTKMWVYADSAPTGWTLDSTPSDELLAIKGGTTYTTGGATAGSFTHGHGAGSHSHSFSGSHSHTYTTVISHKHTVSKGGAGGGAGIVSALDNSATGTVDTSTTGSASGATSTDAASGTTGAPSAGPTDNTTFRPKARVGIICTKD